MKDDKHYEEEKITTLKTKLNTLITSRNNHILKLEKEESMLHKIQQRVLLRREAISDLTTEYNLTDRELANIDGRFTVLPARKPRKKPIITKKDESDLKTLLKDMTIEDIMKLVSKTTKGN